MIKKICAIVLLLQISIFAMAQNLPVPTKVQLEWQKMETIGFVHFSINTFTDMEWGYGNESPILFNPVKLDCRQWARTFKAAGLTGVILTAKHHDGFCLWPSAYTEHSVKNSPWRNGKGDLVREFVDACREYGLKVGLYLSPWDCNHPEYGKIGYIEYYKNQLRELLSNYGELFEIWFDGANGGRGYYGTDSLHVRKIAADYYPWKEIVEIVHRLQPNCVIHGGNFSNIRWVGNEQGYALEEHWSTLRESDQFDRNIKLTDQLMKGHSDGTRWMPSETDVSIRPGWYYHPSEDHKLYSLNKLMDIYYNSVGRNSLLLLNIPPNKDGLINANDSLRLIQWHGLYTKELSHDLINKNMSIKGQNQNNIYKCIDNHQDTYWEARNLTPTIEIDFKKVIMFNRLLLQENIAEGQRVKSFSVEYFKGGKWNQLTQQTTIGYKRILRVPEISTTRIRIHIKDALAVPQISEIELFYATTLIDKPIIRRTSKGQVSIQTANKNATIYYTTNGTVPNRIDGILYKAPFISDGIQHIKAVAFDGNKKSEVSEKYYCDSENMWTTIPAKAIDAIFDEQDNTTWISANGNMELIIDLKDNFLISGLKYLPDQSRYAQGIVEKYAVETSMDGLIYHQEMMGEFANIQNHPVEQNILFNHPIKARFIRFKALSTVNAQKCFGIAELNIIRKYENK